MTKNGHGLHAKLTLVRCHPEVGSCQDTQHFVQVVTHLVKGGTPHNDIIDVDEHTFANQPSKYGISQAGKC
jgi:hypothetical protein